MDNVDYVPTPTPVLFGHHFSSIAGAGPIVGPILAGLWFGWIPALVWILIGAVFVGGVHDYAALIASLRHNGRSIGDICRRYLNPFTYRVFLAFIWFTLVYVLIVFLDLTAATFAPVAAETQRLGGAVATSSLLYIVLALCFGLVTRRGYLSHRSATLVFVPLVFLAIAAGYALPFRAGFVPVLFHGDPKYTWSLILLVYCFLASISPVWVLLQPRDYLSSFLLYACLAVGAVGLVLAGITGRATILYAGFKGWHSPAHGYLFPVLFITVACGAVSGFHSIVSSGTSSKQLDSERSALPVAFGGMLVEAMLALIALAAVMMLSNDSPLIGKHPTVVFANAIGVCCAALHIPAAAGEVFGLLAISTFLLTTLDTATRLSRFILEEFWSIEDRRWRYLTTIGTLVLPAGIAFSRLSLPDGTVVPAWQAVWPAFGATNQLMAALGLLVVFVWLTKRGRPRLFVAVPMLFMMVTTGVSLWLLVRANLWGGGAHVIGVLCVVLFILALLVIADTVIHWRSLLRAEEES
jgi:carbon starvation protein